METLTTTIRQNFETVSENVRRAAVSAGRNENAVRLVVVTKAQPVDVVRAAIAAGARILGENYPEETQPKIQSVGQVENLEWHMIGHLQSRKASIVTAFFDLLQSLDSLRLAEKLERMLAEQGRTLPVLLEFNVSGEESKFGWMGWDESQWDALRGEVEQLLSLPHLRVRGLMTMPPLYDDPEQTRPYFARLRRLAEFLARQYGEDHFRELSMGTSADYAAAVQEGATYVRVGTAIVGPRPPRA